MGSLGTSLLLCYSGARVHAFGVSISPSSSIKCCSKSFNISMVVVTYYISMVCFCDVMVCIIMPGFEILKVHYYSMFLVMLCLSCFQLYTPVSLSVSW